MRATMRLVKRGIDDARNHPDNPDKAMSEERLQYTVKMFAQLKERVKELKALWLIEKENVEKDNKFPALAEEEIAKREELQ